MNAGTATILDFPSAEALKRKRIQEIQDLFDVVATELDLKEVHLFHSLYSDPKEGGEALAAFLKDVTTCPAHVEKYCEQLLAEKRQRPQRMVVQLRA